MSSSSKRSRAAAPAAEGKDDGSAGTPSATCNLPGCTKPKYQDTRVTGGRQHDYCGRTHAREAGACKIEPHGSCRTLCKLEGCEYPCYFDAETERVHDFCSRTCHALALKRGEWSKAGKSVRPEKGKGKGGGKRRKGDSGGLGGARQCGLPGCNRAVFSDPYTTRVFDYCNLDHAQRAKKRGLQRPEEDHIEREFLGGGDESSSQFRVAHLTRQHPKHTGVKEQVRRGPPAGIWGKVLWMEDNGSVRGGCKGVNRVWR